MAIDGMVDGLQRVVEAVHTTAVDVAADFTGAGDIAASQIVDSTSNGVSLVHGKTSSLGKAKLLQAAHSRHKYILRIVRFMLRNSMRNKMRIMIPGFMLSLGVSAVAPGLLHHLRPVFAVFGAHLGMEAAEDTEHLLENRRMRRALAKKSGKKVKTEEAASERTVNQDLTSQNLVSSNLANQGKVGDKSVAPDPEKVLDEKVPDKMTIRQAIQKAHEADKVTTLEITAAVLGSIDNLPISEQIPIMGIYIAGMTAGVYGLTTALVKMEDWGQRLEAWDPEHPLNKALVKTTLPSRIGLGLQQATPRVFRVIPWSGAAAKFVTSGRVISHASSTLEGLNEHASQLVVHLPYIGGELTGYAATVAAWGVTGVAAGLGAQVANKIIYQPMRARIKKSPTVASWRKAAKVTVISTMLSAQQMRPSQKIVHGKRHESYFVSMRPDVPFGLPGSALHMSRA